MTHDVFVSHSHEDKTVADAIVARLEADGIRCWIAPRDIVPGANWGEAIVDAIGGSTVMVLVLSEHSNVSSQVLREVERAVHAGVSILPFRVDEVDPSGALSYFLGTEHWLDAMTPPLEQHIVHLSETVRFLLDRSSDPSGTRAPSPPPGHVPVPLAPPSAPNRRPVVIAAAAGAAVIAGVVVALVLTTGGGDLATSPETTGAATTTTVAPTTAPTTSPTTTPTTTTAPTTSTTAPTTTLPQLALDEVGQFRPFDLDPTDQHVPDPIAGFDIDGRFLAYANGVDGVTRMSIGSPDTPLPMATYSVTNAKAVELDGDLIYAIGVGPDGWRFEVFGTDGFGAVELPLEGTGYTDFDDLEVADGFAYASGWNYIAIIDVTDPSAPELVVDWTPDGSTGNPAHAVIDGTIGYFGAGWDGLYVFDLTDPARPALLDRWISPDWVIDIAVGDDVAYVTLGDSGLAVLDVSDPTAVRQLGAVDLPGFASMVDADGGHVFVGWFSGTSAPGGVAAVDATDPTAPVLAGTFGSFTALTDLQVADGHVFVSDEAEDLVVFRITEEGAGDVG